MVWKRLECKMQKRDKAPAPAMRLNVASIILLVALVAGGGRADPGPAPVERAAFARPSEASDAPVSRQQALLGLKLFRDRRLSGDMSVACDTCHYQGLSFADAKRRAVGVGGELDRNTPPLWNLAFARRFTWDGRLASLQDQIARPIVDPREMGGSWPEIVDRLDADPAMTGAFTDAFGRSVDADSIAHALAAYVRTLVSPMTRFDRFIAGDDAALDDEEREGFGLFAGKAGCVACHKGWRLTDDAVHPTGAADAPDLRTPPLRELLWSGPYLHDGSVDTLEEALVTHAAALATAGRPAASSLTVAERTAVLALLVTLSSADAPRPLIRP